MSAKIFDREYAFRLGIVDELADEGQGQLDSESGVPQSGPALVRALAIAEEFAQGGERVVATHLMNVPR